ncbi:MAG: transketolase family protein [Negativicutes bacterium]|jgi:transketolase
MADKEMRAIYSETLLELADADENIVLLEADLMAASGTKPFMQKYPDRTFDVGVAEANMVGIAAGLSAGGKIPFANTFGCFATRRAFDQFFIACCYAQQNVKLCGTDPGVSAAFNGGTHMPFEDVGLVRTVPNVIIFEPCDPISLKALVQAAAAHKGNTYMRLHRKTLPTVYSEDEKFEFGKGKVLRDGSDVCLIASGGVCVGEALKACDILAAKDISATVIDMHTIKPLDSDLVLQYAKQSKAMLTIENHQIMNGLGSAVCEVIAESGLCLPFKRIGINDLFGEVGKQDYLQERYGLTAKNIVSQVEALLTK